MIFRPLITSGKYAYHTEGLCTLMFKFWRKNSKWSSCQHFVSLKRSGQTVNPPHKLFNFQVMILDRTYLKLKGKWKWHWVGTYLCLWTFVRKRKQGKTKHKQGTQFAFKPISKGGRVAWEMLSEHFCRTLCRSSILKTIPLDLCSSQHFFWLEETTNSNFSHTLRNVSDIFNSVVKWLSEHGNKGPTQQIFPPERLDRIPT